MLLHPTARTAARALPATAIAAVAALSLGAYAGYAARLTARHQPSFTISVAPRHDTISAGSTAGYRLTLRRHRFPWRITFKLGRPLPAGAAAHLAPARTRGTHAAITITTRTWIRAGTYHLLLRARHGKVTRRIVLTLTVAGAATGTGTANAPLPRFSLAGNATAPLEPGVPEAIDLRITNPNPAPLVVTNLSASVRAVSAPGASSLLPCTIRDFSVQRYFGPLPLIVPASSTRSLAGLGVPPAQWPQISIVDRPTDQDGCQGATVTLAYGGVATLG